MELTNYILSSAEQIYVLGASERLDASEHRRCWRIISFERVSSTMDAARCWASEPSLFKGFCYELPIAAPESVSSDCVVFIAREQESGRGRQGNQWVSAPEMGLYVTLLWCVDRPLQELSGLSVAVGTAVAEALEAVGLAPKCKWPNDIVIDDPTGFKKLGGLLIETWSRAGGELWVSAGIGINLRSHASLGAVGGISVEDLGASAQERGLLLRAVVSHVSEAVDVFNESGLGPFLERFEQRSALTGRCVEIRRAGMALEFQVLGIAADGGLRVRSLGERGEEEVLYAGEVTLSHAYRR